jgi:dCMP deaminase
MNRISRDMMFMEMAETAAKRSACYRAGVGCIITKDNVPVSIGYNGPASGEPHCNGQDCELKADGSCQRSLHAEANALTRLGRLEITDALTMYCVYSPCEHCAPLIIHSQTSRLVFRHQYREGFPIQRLMANGILIQKLTTSGFLINQDTKKLEVSR